MNALRKSDHSIPVTSPASNNPPIQASNPQRPFDYGVGYGNRCGYSSGRRYSDLPDRSLFHCL